MDVVFFSCMVVHAYIVSVSGQFARRQGRKKKILYIMHVYIMTRRNQDNVY